MWNSLLFFISNMFHKTQNNVGPLHDHINKEFSLLIAMVTGHAQHCHLAMTYPVIVATIKLIVRIAGYLPYQITESQFQSFAI